MGWVKKTDKTGKEITFFISDSNEINEVKKNASVESKPMKGKVGLPNGIKNLRPDESKINQGSVGLPLLLLSEEKQAERLGITVEDLGMRNAIARKKQLALAKKLADDEQKLRMIRELWVEQGLDNQSVKMLKEKWKKKGLSAIEIEKLQDEIREKKKKFREKYAGGRYSGFFVVSQYGEGQPYSEETFRKKFIDKHSLNSGDALEIIDISIAQSKISAGERFVQQLSRPKDDGESQSEYEMRKNLLDIKLKEWNIDTTKKLDDEDNYRIGGNVQEMQEFFNSEAVIKKLDEGLGGSLDRMIALIPENEARGLTDGQKLEMLYGLGVRQQITTGDKFKKFGSTTNMEQMKKEQEPLMIRNAGESNFDRLSNNDKVKVLTETLQENDREKLVRSQFNEISNDPTKTKEWEKKNGRELILENFNLKVKNESGDVVELKGDDYVKLDTLRSRLRSEVQRETGKSNVGDEVQTYLKLVASKKVGGDENFLETKLDGIMTEMNILARAKKDNPDIDINESMLILEMEKSNIEDTLKEMKKEGIVKIGKDELPQVIIDLLFHRDDEYLNTHPVGLSDSFAKRYILGTTKAPIRNLQFNPAKTARTKNEKYGELAYQAFRPDYKKVLSERNRAQEVLGDMNNDDINRSAGFLTDIIKKMKNEGLLSRNLMTGEESGFEPSMYEDIVTGKRLVGLDVWERKLSLLKSVMNKTVKTSENKLKDLYNQNQKYESGWNDERWRKEMLNIQKIEEYTPQPLSKSYSLKAENFAFDEDGNRVSYLKGSLEKLRDSANSKRLHSYLLGVEKKILEAKFGKNLGDIIHFNKYNIDKDGNMTDEQTGAFLTMPVMEGGKQKTKIVNGKVVLEFTKIPVKKLREIKGGLETGKLLNVIDKEGKIEWNKFLFDKYGGLGEYIRVVGGVPMKTQKAIGEMANSNVRYKYNKKLQEAQKESITADISMLKDLAKRWGAKFNVSNEEMAEYQNRNENFNGEN